PRNGTPPYLMVLFPPLQPLTASRPGAAEGCHFVRQDAKGRGSHSRPLPPVVSSRTRRRVPCVLSLESPASLGVEDDAAAVKHPLTIAVLVCWLTMLALLVRKQASPPTAGSSRCATGQAIVWPRSPSRSRGPSTSRPPSGRASPPPDRLRARATAIRSSVRSRSGASRSRPWSRDARQSTGSRRCASPRRRR